MARAYLYFGLPSQSRIFHFMGSPRRRLLALERERSSPDSGVSDDRRFGPGVDVRAQPIFRTSFHRKAVLKWFGQEPSAARSSRYAAWGGRTPSGWILPLHSQGEGWQDASIVRHAGGSDPLL